MIQFEPDIPKTELPCNTSFVSTLPPGSAIRRIAFVAAHTAAPEVLLELPAPIQRRAILVHGDPDRSEATAGDLSVLTIPVEHRETLPGTECDLLVSMRKWVDAASHVDASPSLTMTFQGAHVCWTQGRLAILAPPGRLEAVQKALIEVSFFEAELRDIERTLGEVWPHLEADMPHAFEFEVRSISKRKQLSQRFQQILLIRARLARIGPHIHCPHLHPPTLASQIGERLRERTRMLHRHESLGEQIEVFERVYEMCGQRASDFMLARTGHTLEWIIIVLLLTQLLLSGFELLTNMGP